MSNKYVPSFLKERMGQNNDTNNKFAPLSDTYANSKVEQVVNTSRPAKEAPKLAPATLASLTRSNTDTTINDTKWNLATNGPKKSYSSRFSEKAATMETTKNSKVIEKVVDVSSECDFPSLGGTGQSIHKSSSGQSFAELAKGWAKKKEEEDLELKRQQQEDERIRQEAAILSRSIIKRRHNKNLSMNIGEEENDTNYNSDDLGEDDYDSPDYMEATSESDENNEDEDEDDYNNDTNYNRRNKNDLY